jgi:hypothetical protein
MQKIERRLPERIDPTGQVTYSRLSILPPPELVEATAPDSPANNLTTEAMERLRIRREIQLQRAYRKYCKQRPAQPFPRSGT